MCTICCLYPLNVSMSLSTCILPAQIANIAVKEEIMLQFHVPSTDFDFNVSCVNHRITLPVADM